MSNNLQTLPEMELFELLNKMSEAIGSSGTAWGLTSAQTTQIGAWKDDWLNMINAVNLAHAEWRGLVQNKRSDRLDINTGLAKIVKTIYNTATVTNAMLAEAGLHPRTSSRQRIVPNVPTNLIAVPNGDGSVSLKWSRNGNPALVSFVIESSPTGASWQPCAYTNKARIVIENCTPGVTAWFRIRAMRSTEISNPSGSVVVFPSGLGSLEEAA